MPVRCRTVAAVDEVAAEATAVEDILRMMTMATATRRATTNAPAAYLQDDQRKDHVTKEEKILENDQQERSLILMVIGTKLRRVDSMAGMS